MKRGYMYLCINSSPGPYTIHAVTGVTVFWSDQIPCPYTIHAALARHRHPQCNQQFYSSETSCRQTKSMSTGATQSSPLQHNQESSKLRQILHITSETPKGQTAGHIITVEQKEHTKNQ